MNYEYSSPHFPLWLQMFLLAGLLAVLATTYVVSSLTQAFLFRKMGIEMWKAWVPVYSGWVFLEAAKLPGAWILLALGGMLPVVGPVFTIACAVILAVAAYRIANAFSKDSALYTVLYVFAAPIYAAILGFNKDKFDADKIPARPVKEDTF